MAHEKRPMKLRSLSIALWLFLAGTARATETVPFVGCAGDGQMGPIAAPRGVNKAFAIDRHAAAQLAFYQAAPFKGVLAPRGWHCFFWYGSNGETLIVAPTRRVETPGSAKLSTPAVILTRRDGDTSGRFAVAQISARLFAQQEADYIQRVIDEGILAKEEFPFGPYPGDKPTYRSGRDVV